MCVRKSFRGATFLRDLRGLCPQVESQLKNLK